jgi:hypothetical protein
MKSELRRPAAKHQRWVRIVILAIGTIVLLAYIGLDPLLRKMTKQDRANGTPHEGTAIVVDRRMPKLDDYDRPIPASVVVRFKGDLYPTERVFGLSELHVDGPAHILYRIGSSGRLYIERVEPIAAPKKSP